MGDKSNIEWTDATWNPIVGCSIVSPGCTNCYAMKWAHSGMKPVKHYNGTTRVVNGKAVWTGKMALAPEHIFTAPLKWKKPRRIFVNSMGDLFHEDVPDAWIDKVFAVMALCPQHTFQILTKRSRRMREYGNRADRISQIMQHWEKFIPMTGERIHSIDWPMNHVWLGVSCEDQARADERIPDLLATQAAIRFVSAEPLLGPIDFENICPSDTQWNALRGVGWSCGNSDDCRFDHNRLDWIIVGGESGPGARPMHPEWARSIRHQCATSSTTFFFKQWGEWAPGECAAGPPTRTERTAKWWNDKWNYDSITLRQSEELHTDDGPDVYHLGKKRAGRMLDGIEHNAVPA